MGYSEFEPINTGSEDDEEEETASQFSVDRRTVSSSSTGSANSQMSRDEETRSIQSRTHMMARMQKQTTRAQHRTNVRERYGLQPDMLDTAFVLGSKILMNNSNNATSARQATAGGTSSTSAG